MIMRLHKVVNRVYEGTTYYRWVLSIPPKSVRELGWVDGQELQASVRGTALLVEPARRAIAGSRGWVPGALAEEVQRKSVGRR
jgi:antitoxin component of MazEF toxin-antitoxin module